MWLLHFKVAEKAVGLESWDAVGDEAYPEIENMFPFDPLGKSSWGSFNNKLSVDAVRLSLSCCDN